MPPLLEAAEFLPASLPLVADFSCGDTIWGTAMNDWIKSPPTARFGTSRHDTIVWLYYHPDGRIVGFGSLGTTQWKYPPPNGPRKEFSYIPALAIQTFFQHLPPDGLNNPRFSHQILADLIAKAVSQSSDYVALLVHPENLCAIAVYRRFGFVTMPGSDKNGNVKMVRRLR
jgi:ribosomal protein S18 acetylase RimI-like enzyme